MLSPATSTGWDAVSDVPRGQHEPVAFPPSATKQFNIQQLQLQQQQHALYKAQYNPAVTGNGSINAGYNQLKYDFCFKVRITFYCLACKFVCNFFYVLVFFFVAVTTFKILIFRY